MREISSAEDLVGTSWFCPSCGEERIITRMGVKHICAGHWFMLTLDMLYEYHLMRKEFKKREYKLFFD